MSLIVADSPSGRRQCAGLIAEGGVVAFKTDTFYALGADPFNLNALRTIYQLKGREAGKPILVLISDQSLVEKFIASRTSAFDILASNHWPGPLTIVARALPTVSDILTGDTGNVGLRLPSDESVRGFLRACGGSLTGTSANPSGSPPAKSAKEVAQYFPNGLSSILDSGLTSEFKPSTVVSTGAPRPRLIREGLVSLKDLERNLPGLEREVQQG